MSRLLAAVLQFIVAMALSYLVYDHLDLKQYLIFSVLLTVYSFLCGLSAIETYKEMS